MSNTRQVAIGWLAYATDLGDGLPAAKGANGTLIGGDLNWTLAPANFDDSILMNGTLSSLAPYLKSSKVFKCPADKYEIAGSPGPRIRSISINGVLAGEGGGSGPTVQGTGPGQRLYFGAGGLGIGKPVLRMSELVSPGPAMTFLTLDEHADSLSDALFMHDPGYPAGSEKWRDLPASYHCGAGSISYCDGHSEIHKWKDGPSPSAKILYPVRYIDWSTSSDRSLNMVKSDAYEWLDARMPYKQQ
jgi:hypothetical protein